MKKLFVVSDVHSFYKEMMAALTAKGFDIENKEHLFVVCGDLFDRGSEALACYEFIKRMHAEHRLVYVRGNHEDFLRPCFNQLMRDDNCSDHYWTNGTVPTLAQIGGIDIIDLFYNGLRAPHIREKCEEFLDFIDEATIDYATFGDLWFVHGWIPEGPREDWDAQKWETARWTNGMEAWSHGIRVPNTMIVCGHYHCSWGWARLRGGRPEFPKLDVPNWQKSFEPFVEDGITAIDAATAYTHIVNCVVFEI